jgi:hypothetical protein
VGKPALRTTRLDTSVLVKPLREQALAPAKLITNDPSKASRLPDLLWEIREGRKVTRQDGRR